MASLRRPTPDPVSAGQESVWDYPRPPRLERTTAHIVVSLDGHRVVDTTNAWRVLETSHPPAYYLPPEDCDLSVLVAAPGSSFCEWKGSAQYWTVDVGTAVAERCGWSYPEPTASFAPIAGHFAFYPAALDCTVDGEAVTPQPGTFYGGWITANIRGPFKGIPGSQGW